MKKEKEQGKLCPYCDGHITKSQDPILPFICLKCGEWLLADEVKEVTT